MGDPNEKSAIESKLSDAVKPAYEQAATGAYTWTDDKGNTFPIDSVQSAISAAKAGATGPGLPVKFRDDTYLVSPEDFAKATDIDGWKLLVGGAAQSRILKANYEAGVQREGDNNLGTAINTLRSFVDFSERTPEETLRDKQQVEANPVIHGLTLAGGAVGTSLVSGGALNAVRGAAGLTQLGRAGQLGMVALHEGTVAGITEHAASKMQDRDFSPEIMAAETALGMGIVGLTSKIAGIRKARPSSAQDLDVTVAGGGPREAVADSVFSAQNVEGSLRELKKTVSGKVSSETAGTIDTLIARSPEAQEAFSRGRKAKPLIDEAADSVGKAEDGDFIKGLDHKLFSGPDGDMDGIYAIRDAYRAMAHELDPLVAPMKVKAPGGGYESIPLSKQLARADQLAGQLAGGGSRGAKDNYISALSAMKRYEKMGVDVTPLRNALTDRVAWGDEVVDAFNGIGPARESVDEILGKLKAMESAPRLDDAVQILEEITEVTRSLKRAKVSEEITQNLRKAAKTLSDEIIGTAKRPGPAAHRSSFDQVLERVRNEVPATPGASSAWDTLVSGKSVAQDAVTEVSTKEAEARVWRSRLRDSLENLKTEADTVVEAGGKASNFDDAARINPAAINSALEIEARKVAQEAMKAESAAARARESAAKSVRLEAEKAAKKADAAAEAAAKEAEKAAKSQRSKDVSEARSRQKAAEDRAAEMRLRIREAKLAEKEAARESKWYDIFSKKNGGLLEGSILGRGSAHLASSLLAFPGAGFLAKKSVPRIFNAVSVGIDDAAVQVGRVLRGDVTGPAIRYSATRGYLFMTSEEKRFVTEEMRSSLTDTVLNPQAMIDEEEERISGAYGGLPMSRNATSAVSVRASLYLYENAPQNKDMSGMEVDDFLSRVDVVENPFSFMDLVASGMVNSAHVEAMQVVYPHLYAEMMAAALSQAGDVDSMSFRGKQILQIATGGVSLDPLLSPEFIEVLQNNGAQTEQQDAAQSGGTLRTNSNVTQSIARNHTTSAARVGVI